MLATVPGVGVFASFSKSGKLLKIARVLGTPQHADDFLASMKSGQNPRTAAENALYDLCEGDIKCRAVMEKHGATRETLREVYWKLLAGGAGQWVGAHYVAGGLAGIAGDAGAHGTPPPIQVVSSSVRALTLEDRVSSRGTRKPPRSMRMPALMSRETAFRAAFSTFAPVRR